MTDLPNNTEPYRFQACTWSNREREIRRVRTEVFTGEQGVDPSLDFDGSDGTSFHILASLHELPIATGRMHPDGRIGRVAVLRNHRKRGLGTEIIKRLTLHAEQLGLNAVFLHAQKDAVNFYEKLGFQSTGSVFIEAGIEHVSMKRPI